MTSSSQGPPPDDDGKTVEPPTEARPATPPAEEVLGPYRLIQKLGEGGMGEVWLAEQREPVRRRVAVKVIKRGMDTREVIARFEAERQALAMMDHPAIAKVFDAGETPRGRPYFVMEHVRGVPITDHCDRHRLTTAERLHLFRQVCEGVQHAHHKALIHRDLKPSNVLVSIQEDQATPRIIDFGVAKAIAQPLTDKTMRTRVGTMIGTPEYMSPEQADLTGQDVDTRTDVYALGVILYELLVGAMPFDPEALRRAGLGTIVRTLREEEPPRPSTRLTALGDEATAAAERRQTDVRSLQRALAGDLDWIVLKALEKDRTRRYDSPRELADDLGRYLDDQPVTARPPSAGYRAGKFLRRHAFGVATAVIGVLLLVVFAVAMAVQARRIAVERDRAERAAADLEQVTEFQADMLAKVDPAAVGRRLAADLEGRVREAALAKGAAPESADAAAAAFGTAIRDINSTDAALRLIDEEILAGAVDTLAERFEGQPLVEARLRQTIGGTYLRLGLYPAAEEQARQARQIRRSVLGEDHPDTLAAERLLGTILTRQGRYEDAERLLVQTLAARRRVLGEDHPETLESMYSLAVIYRILGRYSEAEPLILAVFEGRKERLGVEDPATLSAMNALGILYKEQGRFAEAEEVLRAKLASHLRVDGEDGRNTLRSMDNLGGVLYRQARFAEAYELFGAALAGRQRVLGDEHPDTLNAMNNVAAVTMEMGRFDEAERLWLAAFDIQRRLLGESHQQTLRSNHNLGELYLEQGRLADAERSLTATLAARQRTLGSEHRETLSSHHYLAEVRRAQGRLDEAERLHREILATRTRALGAEHPETLRSIAALADLLHGQGREEESIVVWQQVLELSTRVLGADHPDTGMAASSLARRYRDAGRSEEAAELFEQAHRALTRSFPADHALVVDNLAAWDDLRQKLDGSGPKRLSED